jgi:hypothetical protein
MGKGIKVVEKTVENSVLNGPWPLTNFFKSVIVGRPVLMIK